MIEWIGTTRYVYNRALQYLKETKEPCRFQTLRNKFVTKKNNPLVEDWEVRTPKDIRAGGLKDLEIAYKAAFSNLKQGNILKFDLRYRTRKKSFSISIPSSALKNIKNGIQIYPSYTDKKPIKTSKDKALLKLDFNHDCRLKLDNGKWYLFVPYDVNIQKLNTTGKCALDPGIRKFQTIYSENSVEIIRLRKEKLVKLQNKLSLLQSLRDKKSISKSHYIRGIRRVYFRIGNIIDDMHYKTINKLVSEYKTIFIPRFESQDIVRINKNRSSRRLCLTLEHYKFRNRLISKAEIVNSDVVVCTEEYTSKTCGKCGILNDIGSNEVYQCNTCGLRIDRDINGARNILIKCLRDID